MKFLWKLKSCLDWVANHIIPIMIFAIVIPFFLPRPEIWLMFGICGMGLFVVVTVLLLTFFLGKENMSRYVD